MHVCIIANTFPNKPQTFVVQQILGLHRRDVELDVYAKNCEISSSEIKETFPELAASEIMGKIHYYAPATGKRFMELFQYTGNIISYCLRHPRKVPVLYSFIRQTKDYASLKILARADEIVRQEYTAYLCQFGPLGNNALLLNMLYGQKAKIATMFRGSDLSSYLNKHPSVYSLLAKEGDLFLPVSSFFQNRLIEKGVSPEKIEVHYSGIDCGRFTLLKNDDRHRKNPDFTFISVGRFTEKKGFEYILEATDALYRKGKRFKLLFIGEGPLKTRLQAVIEKKEMTEYVSLLPWVPHDQLLNYYRSADVFVSHNIVPVSGDMEGIPNVLKEAMATGLPVISTFHAGIGDLIQNGVNGFLVKERDTVALSERMKMVMEEMERLEEMKLEARRYIEKYFDIEILSTRLSQLLA